MAASYTVFREQKITVFRYSRNSVQSAFPKLLILKGSKVGTVPALKGAKPGMALGRNTGNINMNGQAKALIPALIGIVTLLLTGITGIVNMPGEKQAIAIAETRAVTLEEYSRQSLGAEFRADADAAARSIGLGVTAGKAGVLMHELPLSVAQTTAAASDQG